MLAVMCFFFIETSVTHWCLLIEPSCRRIACVNCPVMCAGFMAKMNEMNGNPMLTCSDGYPPQFNRQQKAEKPVVGVIGDQSSDITIQVLDLSQESSKKIPKNPRGAHKRVSRNDRLTALFHPFPISPVDNHQLVFK